MPVLVPMTQQTSLIERMIEVGGPPVAMALVFAIILVWLLRTRRDEQREQATAFAAAFKEQSEAATAAFKEQGARHSEDISRLASGMASQGKGMSEIATSIRETTGETQAVLREFTRGVSELTALVKYTRRSNGGDGSGNRG